MRSCSLGRVLRMESIVSLVIINFAPALELLLLLNFHFLDYDGLKVSLNQFSHQSVIDEDEDEDEASPPTLEYT